MRSCNAKSRRRTAQAEIGLVGLAMLLLAPVTAIAQVPAPEGTTDADAASDGAGLDVQSTEKVSAPAEVSSQSSTQTTSSATHSSQAATRLPDGANADAVLAPTALGAATATLQAAELPKSNPPPSAISRPGIAQHDIDRFGDTGRPALGAARNTVEGAERKDQPQPSLAKPSEDRKSRFIGAALDAGIPDGVMGGVSVRPCSILRVHSALGTNAISLGFRAGLTLRLPTTISPTLAVEGGHYFEGNANYIASRVVGSTYRSSPVADALGYQFANFHAGVEFGNERSTLYLQGGVTYIRARLRNTNETLNACDNSSDRSISIDVHGDPLLSAWIPSIKIGFLVYLV